MSGESLLTRPSTPDDWTDLVVDEDSPQAVQSRKDVNIELNEVKSVLNQLTEETVDSSTIRKQKAAQQYGRELQQQIEQMESAPRPPFETISHLRQRIERENELYRRQFVWQMENSEVGEDDTPPLACPPSNRPIVYVYTKECRKCNEYPVIGLALECNFRLSMTCGIQPMLR
ncbi:unnamed protein product [Haemonchus placei]|uniref:ERM domain-containing protein n=1 Tax=Haemonchus placei TaxID=6290 RepID=A0A0N4X1F4_HAEPC|nr:unnamed protein product [Haemonchus placei]